MGWGWLAAPQSLMAQGRPWVTFQDAVSSSVCDVIHTTNAELLLLRDSNNLVLVGGPDVVLSDAFVDEEGNVLFEGLPAGIIDFQTDGNNFRTLWWTGLTGNVVELDEFTGAPTGTDSRPSDFRNVGCDGCDFWDDASICAEPEPPPEEPVTVRICGQDVMFPLALMGLTFLMLRFSRTPMR